MARYILKPGTGAHYEQGVLYKAQAGGKPVIVESDSPLHKKHPDKFERKRSALDDEEELTDEDEDKVTEAETEVEDETAAKTETDAGDEKPRGKKNKK